MSAAWFRARAQRSAPPCRASPVTAGCGAQSKAQGPPVPSGGLQVRGRPDGPVFYHAYCQPSGDEFPGGSRRRG